MGLWQVGAGGIIRLGSTEMVVAGEDIDIGVAAFADLGARIVFPVVDLVAVSLGLPAVVVVADHAFLHVLRKGDRAEAHPIDLVLEGRVIDGGMNLVDQDRQVSIVLLHEGPIVPQRAVTDDAGPRIEVPVGMGRFHETPRCGIACRRRR